MSSIDSIKNKIQQIVANQTSSSDDYYTIDEKIEELKEDSRFADWSEIELQDYVIGVIAQNNAQSYLLFMDSINSKSGKPTDPEWAQYTYEEILQMEDNGVNIPDEVLEWAHSMQSTNVTEYELDSGDANNINDVESTKTDVGDSGNMGLTNVAKVFTKKVVLQEEALTEAEREFEQYSNEMEVMTDEALTVQNNALKEVQDMMNEWQSINNKVKNGEELTADEQSRYGELGLLMNNIVSNSTMQISGFTSDFDDISKLMTSASDEAKIAQDYANDTSFTGTLIAQYETSQDTKMVSGNNHIFDGATGVVDLVKSNAIGKNLAVSSIKQSGYLQTATFNTDKKIKEVSSQMENMTDEVNAGGNDISRIISEGLNSTTLVEPQHAETPDAAPVPAEDDMNTLPPPPVNEQDNQNQNVFVQQEDFNNIDNIIKRQQKSPPKMQPQDIIIDS